jgi:peptide/nickel transport system permease protein
MLPEKYDVFYGLVWGTRAAMALGLIVVLGRALLGTLVGLIAGYSGGLLDALLMRLADAFMAFPMIAAAVVMLSLYGFVRERYAAGWIMLQPTRQEQIIMLAFVLFGWVPYARLMRGNMLVEKEKTYIKAARSTGVPGLRLIIRHLLPNSTQGLIALASSDIGAVVVLVSAFTFIGIITPQSGPGMMADWGFMLEAARDWIIGPPARAFEHWYTYMPVSLALVLFSTGWSLVGDGVRDALDPRLRGWGVRKSRQPQPVKIEELTPLALPVAPQFQASDLPSLERRRESEIPLSMEDTSPVRIGRKGGVRLDDEAAFAWLEYLAVRQGAREALLLQPEQRRPEPPEWVNSGRMPQRSEFSREGSTDFAEARRWMEEGDLERALPRYQELIRARRCLEEVIQDLSQAPAQIGVLEALGDAHLRLGHTRQAMEAYAEAERLIKTLER